MKRIVPVLVVSITIAVFFAGCGGGGSTSVLPKNQSQTSAARILSVAPSDGVADVATDTVFTVTFSHPMNMESVHDNFHIYEGTTASGDPMAGDFSWNDMHTTMAFDPAQNFMSNATHTVHFGTGMMCESGCMMMNMSGNMMDTDMYTYFMTD